MKSYMRKDTIELRVMNFLRKHPMKFFSMRELYKYVGEDRNERYFRRAVQLMADAGTIYKQHASGGMLVYTSNHQLKDVKKHRYVEPDAEEKSAPEIPRIDVHARSVRSLLKGWSEEKWNPKIFHSAQYLPLSVARLFELVSEVLYGSTVSKSDLMEIKANLEIFKRDLIATSSTVVSLLETEEVWDPDRFFEFLMSEDAPPVDLLKDYVHKLKENYK